MKDSFFMIRPPHGEATSDPTATKTDAIGAASATYPILGVDGLPFGGCFVRWYFTTDCYVRFGSASVAAATANDAEFKAGEWHRFWHDAQDTHVSVLRKSADGLVKRHRSDL